MLDKFSVLTDELTEKVKTASSISDTQQEAHYYQEEVIAKMNELREIGDKMETETARNFWPYPSYTDLLFGV